MSKAKRLCVFAVVLLCLLAGVASAQSLVIVRGDGQYPPNEMVVDGVLQGIHIDLLREAASDLEIEIEFRSLPWKRAVQMIETGMADAITYIGRSQEREAFTEFLEGNIISYSTNAFLVRADDTLKINYTGDLAKLRNYSVGVLRGYFYGEAFDQAQFKKKLQVDTMKQLLELLTKQRIDLAIVNTTDFRYSYGADPLVANIVQLAKPLSSVANYIGFSRTGQTPLISDIARQFADRISTIRQTNRYQRILLKYGML